MKPTPAESPHRRRRDMPPRSPSYRSAFPAAADGDRDTTVSEHPCVTLVEWWLATVEGDDQKIAVAGEFERNQIRHEYSSAPIAKCLTPTVLETEDGTILQIQGSHKVSQTFRNGYSKEVCEGFLNGFPHWWQSCKLLYPMNTSNSGVDSTQFYLDKFELGKHLHSDTTHFLSKYDLWGSFSGNDAVFPKSSNLLNGKPRFEEYTWDGDIAANETATSNETATDRKRTRVASLKSQIVRRSPRAKIPVSYAASSHYMAMLTSMSTPEALKLKRSRSGRVLVPKLDDGCQNIVYGGDGSILGINGLDSPATPKLSAGSESRTEGRKKEGKD